MREGNMGSAMKRSSESSNVSLRGFAAIIVSDGKQQQFLLGTQVLHLCEAAKQWDADAHFSRRHPPATGPYADDDDAAASDG